MLRLLQRSVPPQELVIITSTAQAMAHHTQAFLDVLETDHGMYTSLVKAVCSALQAGNRSASPSRACML